MLDREEYEGYEREYEEAASEGSFIELTVGEAVFVLDVVRAVWLCSLAGRIQCDVSEYSIVVYFPVNAVVVTGRA